MIIRKLTASWMGVAACVLLSLFIQACSKGENPVDPEPELRAPTGLAIDAVSGTAFRLVWDEVPGADAYETTVALDEEFTQILSSYDRVRDFVPQLNVIDLDPETEYFARVRTLIGTETSAYSPTISVTTEEGVGSEPGTALKTVATTFAVGMAVSTPKLGGQYDAIYKREYNSLTAEYEMKMNFMYPSEGNYDFSRADEIVDYATANGMHVHGHALIWHAATPSWVENFSGTDSAFEAMVEDYIKTTVSRYAGRVRSWDVVNEAFEDGSGALRNSVFRQRMGDDYIEKCYRWTREADPDVLIFYNDYNMVIDDTKRGAALALMDDFISRGVPVDGFGFQMHIAYNGPSKSKIQSTAKEVTDRGLLLHFSELDVRANPGNDLSYLTLDRSIDQAKKVQEVVEVYNAIPEVSKFALTIWGLRDNDSWLLNFWGQPDWPLLYDDSFNFKKAHTGFIDGLE